MKDETRCQSNALFDLSWEGVHRVTQFIYLFIYLCYSEHVHVQEWDDYESSISIDFVMPNKFQ